MSSCTSRSRSFFQELRKYILGPRFGLVADEHQMILGLEGLNDPLISEIEAENDEYTLWGFWEQVSDPTLRFELSIPVDGTLKDNEALSENDAQPILNKPQLQGEESATHMSNIDPEENASSSSMSSSSSSTPSSSYNLSLTSTPSEDSVANSSSYLDQHTVLDVDQKTAMDLNKKLVMDLEKQTVMDLTVLGSTLYMELVRDSRATWS